MDTKKKLLAGSVVGVSLVAGVVAGLPSGALSSGSATTKTTPTAAAVASPSPAVASPSSAPAAGQRCDANRDDEWPDVANGTPAGFDAGDTGGVYLWHNEDGWHLRVTHRGDHSRVFTGTIWTAGTIDHVAPVKFEKDDSFKTGPDDHAVTLRFVNYGGIDGIDFVTHCAEGLHVNLKVDGRQLPLDRVFVGHTSFHPTSMPFAIRRNSDGRH
jgi:hypothetical protein